MDGVYEAARPGVDDGRMYTITTTLGTAHPIVCAPMAGVAGGRLARAVSAAGGLGMIGAGGSASPEWIGEQAATAGADGLPFGIGLMAWVPRLSEQLAAVTALTGRSRPALVSISFGELAGPIAMLREAGLRTACQVGNGADLQAALQAGVDVVVARGSEAGGHGRDEVDAATLLDLALAATDRPVLAAGGIADGADVDRVLRSGAAGAWCGTAFLTCREGENSPASRAALAGAGATRYSRVHDVAQGIAGPREFGGRAVETPFVRAWAGREEEMTAVAKAEHAAGRAADDPALTPLYAGTGVTRLGPETDAASVLASLIRVDHP